MPPRNKIPPVLAARSPELIAHFVRDYEAATTAEKQLPREQRFVTNIGASYAAIGWLLFREFYRRPAGARLPPLKRPRRDAKENSA